MTQEEDNDGTIEGYMDAIIDRRKAEKAAKGVQNQAFAIFLSEKVQQYAKRIDAAADQGEGDLVAIHVHRALLSVRELYRASHKIQYQETKTPK